jgi:acyl-CoA reductase-like NAD-dependent aldehyde dehydrogenase
MLQIVQAYDRSPIARVATDDADALEAKLALAVRTIRDRDHWLAPHQRIEILFRLASLMDAVRRAAAVGLWDRWDSLVDARDDAREDGRPQTLRCPVDYSENIRLTDQLGKLVQPFLCNDS